MNPDAYAVLVQYLNKHFPSVEAQVGTTDSSMYASFMAEDNGLYLVMETIQEWARSFKLRPFFTINTLSTIRTFVVCVGLEAR